MTTEELETWQRLNECEAVKKVRGEWLIRDLAYDNNSQQHVYFDGGVFIDDQGWGVCENDLTWIPHLYDPIRPERSLWGMMDWDAPYTPPLVDGREEFFIRPDLAIAKAIIERSK